MHTHTPPPRILPLCSLSLSLPKPRSDPPAYVVLVFDMLQFLWRRVPFNATLRPGAANKLPHGVKLPSGPCQAVPRDTCDARGISNESSSLSFFLGHICFLASLSRFLSFFPDHPPPTTPLYAIGRCGLPPLWPSIKLMTDHDAVEAVLRRKSSHHRTG